MLLGIILVLIGTSAYNGSVVLLALAARSRRERGGAGLIVGVARRSHGAGGMALTGVGWVSELFALTRLPLTVDKIVMTAGFALLLALAHWGLRERVRRAEILGVLAIATGIAAVSVLPPARGEAPPSLPRWLVMIAILVPGILVPQLLHRRHERPRPLLNAVAAGLAYALGGLFTKGIADELPAPGLVALALLTAGALTVSLLGFMNELPALQRGRTAAVVPVIAALQTLVPIAFAPVFFAETWPPGLLAHLLVAAAIALTLAGVIILSRVPAEILSEASV